MTKTTKELKASLSEKGKTIKSCKIGHEEAFLVYCEMGSKERSIDRLHKELTQKRDKNGIKTPNRNTLGDWSKTHNWQEKVRKYDEKLTVKLLEGSIEKMRKKLMKEVDGLDVYDRLVDTLVKDFEKRVQEAQARGDKIFKEQATNPEILSRMYEARKGFVTAKTQLIEKLMRYQQSIEDRSIKKDELAISKRMLVIRETEHEIKQGILQAELRAKNAIADIKELELKAKQEFLSKEGATEKGLKVLIEGYKPDSVE